MINGLDLFSGIGGLSLALSEWVRPIAYCENDRYAQAVLLGRMADNLLATAPIWDDVRTLNARDFRRIDIIYGGFPCQDISCAGAGIGLGGERSGLFFEILRLAKEIRPKFIFLENVPAIRTRGLEHVAEGLACAGYDCRWDFISAQEVGAPHIRKRWFCLAHSVRERGRLQQGRRFGPSGKDSPDTESYGARQSLADAASKRKRESTNKTDAESVGRKTRDEPFDRSWWEIEPQLGRVANGVPARVDRLRGLGNAVVPIQAKEAFMRLMGLK